VSSTERAALARVETAKRARRLTRKQWAALVLCGLGLTQAEAAELLGVTQSAVSYRISRAKRHILRRCERIRN